MIDSLKTKNFNSYKEYFEKLFSIYSSTNYYKKYETIDQIFNENKYDESFLSDIAACSLRILRKLNQTDIIIKMTYILKKNNDFFINNKEDNKVLYKNFLDNYEDDLKKQYEMAVKISKEELVLEQLKEEDEIQLLIEKSKEEEEERELELAKKKSIEEEEKRLKLKEEKNYTKNPYDMNINENSFYDNKDEEEFDEEYGICPITLEYMNIPVLAPSGNYYEKSAILDWLKRNNTDPLSREFLSVELLIEDNNYKQKIIEYRKKFNK